MGFFKDFKDDLSQAVDELTMEEAAAAQNDTAKSVEDILNEAEALASVDPVPTEELPADDVDPEQLSFMDMNIEADALQAEGSDIATELAEDTPAADDADSFDDVSFGVTEDAPEIEEIPDEPESIPDLDALLGAADEIPEEIAEEITEEIPAEDIPEEIPEETIEEPEAEPEPIEEAVIEPEPEPEPEIKDEPEPEIKDEPEPILEFDEVSVDIQDEPAEPEEEISIFEAGMNEEETEEDLSIPEETYETAAAPAAASKIDTSIFEENKKMSEEIEFDINDGPATDESSVITQGMTITGDITSEGSLDVIGTIQGNIAIRGKLTISGTINGDSKAGEIFADSAKITGEVCSSGSVKIGQASVILGNVSGTSAVIAGAVKGDIDVHGPVILDTSAIVMGDIKSKSVQINNGAVIEGHCSQCYADVSPTSFFQELKE